MGMNTLSRRILLGVTAALRGRIGVVTNHITPPIVLPLGLALLLPVRARRVEGAPA